MTTTITLTNSFHHTSANIRPAPDGTISRATERRAWRKLCGMTDCRCSGYGGVRGGGVFLEPITNRYGEEALTRFLVLGEHTGARVLGHTTEG